MQAAAARLRVILAISLHRGDRRPDLPGLALSALVTAWIGWWTACACRDYLRLDQPLRVAAALTAIVFLSAMAAQLWATVLS